MTENFYTNVIQKGNTLLVRAIENGKKVQRSVKYKPVLFTPTKEKTAYKTLDGHGLKPIQLAGMREARDFLKNYEDQPGTCLLYTSPSPRDGLLSRMPSSA